MKSNLKTIPGDRLDKEQWAIDNPRPKRVLRAPHFPNHPDVDKEVVHGTLRSWLDKLSKK